MEKNRVLWQKFLFIGIFILWTWHLFKYIKYDKFRVPGDTVYFTDEGFWTYSARHKYLFGTWYDDTCHYNHRFFVTPLFTLVEYASIKAFGLNEFGVRFPSVFFYILTVLLFTFYIVHVRKKSYLIALFILFPFFIERFFLTQFTMAVLEPLLIFLISLSVIMFTYHEKTNRDIFLYLSLLFAVLSFFVKSHGIVIAFPLILLSKKDINQKVMMAILVFSIPVLWTIFVRVFYPLSYHALRYDLFYGPRMKDFAGIFLKDYSLNPFHLFLTPVFWLFVYIFLVKIDARSIHKEDVLPFTIVVIVYFVTVFIMGLYIRYNLIALPAYVLGTLYLYDKKLSLRKGWIGILFISIIMLIIQFFNYRYLIISLNNVFLRILALWLPYIVLYFIYKKFGLSIREMLFIFLLINGLVFIAPKIKNPQGAILYLAYVMIVNLIVVLISFNGVQKQRTSFAFSYPFFVFLLYVIIGPVYLKNEIGYIEGRNKFREVINKCINDRGVKFDMVGGRASDNIMLFKRKKVIGVLGPDYEIGPSHRDKGYIQDTTCLKHKKILVLGFPFQHKVSLNKDPYFDEFLHALPLYPDSISYIGTCKFIYDIDTTNAQSLYYMNLYLIDF